MHAIKLVNKKNYWFPLKIQAFENAHRLASLDEGRLWHNKKILSTPTLKETGVLKNSINFMWW